MKKFSILIVIFLISCGPQQFLTEQEYKAIPKTATQIIIHFDGDIDSLYDELIGKLFFLGYRIENADRILHYITTSDYDCGGDTFLRMSINLISGEKEVMAIISPQWRYGQQSQIIMSSMVGYNSVPQWNTAKPGQLGKSNLAFTTALRLAQSITDNITFR